MPTIKQKEKTSSEKNEKLTRKPSSNQKKTKVELPPIEIRAEKSEEKSKPVKASKDSVTGDVTPKEGSPYTGQPFDIEYDIRKESEYLNSSFTNAKTTKEYNNRRKFAEVTGNSPLDDVEANYSVITDAIRSPALKPLGVTESIVEGLKNDVNNYIRAFNNLTDAEIEELEHIKGSKDNLWYSLFATEGVNSATGLGILAAGVTAGLFSAPLAGIATAATALTYGSVLLGQYTKLYEDDKQLVEDQTGLAEGLLVGPRSSEQSDLERFVRGTIDEAFTSGVLSLAGFLGGKVVRKVFKSKKPKLPPLPDELPPLPHDAVDNVLRKASDNVAPVDGPKPTDFVAVPNTKKPKNLHALKHSREVQDALEERAKMQAKLEISNELLQSKERALKAVNEDKELYQAIFSEGDAPLKADPNVLGGRLLIRR